MSKLPWMKFYPADWRSDAALRTCSLAARGLWIEMLTLMHQSDPRGSLTINGKNITMPQLSILAGCSAGEAESLCKELEDAGVFSRKKNGVIFSRRIESDENKSRINKENGKLGGNPSLSNDEEKEKSVNPPDKPLDKAKRLEARVEREERKNYLYENEKPEPSKLKSKYSEHFETFWKSYPTDPGMSKTETFKAWINLNQIEREQAVGAIGGFKTWVAKQGRDYRTLHACRFISQRRFEGFSATITDWPKRLAVSRTMKSWDYNHYGPPPHAAGCLVPQELLQPDDGVGWAKWAA